MKKQISKRINVIVIKYYVERTVEWLFFATIIPFLYLVLHFNRNATLFCVVYSILSLVRGVGLIKERESNLILIPSLMLLLGGMFFIILAFVIYIDWM